MRNFSIFLIFSFLLSGCAFVDEAAITKKEAITPADFIKQSMTEIGSREEVPQKDIVIKEDDSSRSTGTLNGSKGITTNISTKKSTLGEKITNEQNATSSGSSASTGAIKDPADKDIENLINSLFDSTEL